MTQVKPGDKVRIHYTGTLADGSVFDSSEGRDPLEFTVGSGQIIPGLDAALPGMSEGEEKTVTIAPEQAYGPVNPDARHAVPRNQVPDNIPLEVGTMLELRTPEGQAMPVQVVEVTEDQVTLDANHPLAGKELTFAFSIVEIA
ncbi:peptidylprolyl isomerase [Defluviimonas sp. 20V17]|uniref:Peptidyl-prolyl cis-trans isomerase n=1 Tax=Allgaiera indica TaxID=765699 RepID=A0AAN4URC0_9RHOB|nr:peptidylprolyl isomerase [Allgaiera indica]KDB02439.1 peptidylprolyl isomerase [Defluviimonas sp. 20V17]GHE02067.1 peptidyl-prolyl cis-trans isomerase [Allgaiera indica]SDX04346.1 peptidylprolyl isomerase [Allgaiera indica]